MRYVTIGSNVVGHLKDNMSKDDVCVGSIVGVSPLSVLYSTGKSAILADGLPPLEKAAIDDINNAKFNALIEKKDSIDCIVIDVLDMRLPVICMVMGNGETYAITDMGHYHQFTDEIDALLEKAAGSKIVSKSRISPNDFSEEDFRDYAKRYSDFLKKSFPSKEIILLEARLVLESFDASKHYSVNQNSEELCTYNYVDHMMFEFLKDEIDCRIVPLPKFTVEWNPEVLGIYHYPKTYYEYARDYIHSFENHSEDEIFTKYQDIFEVDFKKVVCQKMSSLIRKYRGNRRLLLLGNPNDVISLKSACDVDSCDLVRYDERTSKQELMESLEKYRNGSENYLIVIPELFRGYSVDSVMSELGYLMGRDYVTPKHELVTVSFGRGIYEDVFNNLIETDGFAMNVQLEGGGAHLECMHTQNEGRKSEIRVGNQVSVYVGQNVKTVRLRIRAYDGSSLVIGEQTSFAENCGIRLTFFSNIRIGKDCMFSTGVIIFCGDSHAIFDLKSGKNTNYFSEEKRNIVLAEHVWVGYQAFLLSKTDIGSGSVVGARSLTNKKFPNNCVIAGSPAKIVKRDIAWNRNPLIQTMDDFDHPEYCNLTKDFNDDE